MGASLCRHRWSQPRAIASSAGAAAPALGRPAIATATASLWGRAPASWHEGRPECILKEDTQKEATAAPSSFHQVCFRHQRCSLTVANLFPPHILDRFKHFPRRLQRPSQPHPSCFYSALGPTPQALHCGVQGQLCAT